MKRDVLSDVQAQRRFAHRWPSRENHQISRLHTGREPIDVAKSGRDTGDHFPLGIQLLEQLCRGQLHVSDGNETAAQPLL